MNCKQARSVFIEYLDRTLAPEEDNALRTHLAQCPRCADELATLIEVQTRLRNFLRVRAADQTVRAQAWHALRKGIELLSSQAVDHRAKPLRDSAAQVKAFPNFSFTRRMTMKAKLLFTFLALALIAAGIVLFAPGVRAQVEPLLRWFSFEGPATGEKVSISVAAEYTPLRPAYLPPGFEAMVVGLNPEATVLRYWNKNTGQILLIDQTLMVGETIPLPAGKPLTIQGRPAVLIEGVSGDLTFVQLTPTPVSPLPSSEAPEAQPPQTQTRHVAEVETVSYHNAKQLIWDIGNLRVQITSNLPLEEMVKIAESLVSAEEPNPPPLPGAQEPGLP